MNFSVQTFLFCLIGWGLWCGSSFSQIRPPYPQVPRPSGPPAIRYRTFPVRLSGGQYRVYLLVEMQYDMLAFVREDSLYQAQAEIEVAFRHQKSGQALIRSWQTRLSTPSFETTNRKDLYHFTLDSLELAPATYELVFKFRDLNGDRRWQKTSQLKLRAQDSLFVSPLLFLYSQHPPKPVSIFPDRPSAFREKWPFNQDLILFFQWGPSSMATLQRVAIHIWPEEEEDTTSYLDTTFSTAPHQSFISVNLKTHLLEEGHYTIERVLYFPTDSLVQRDPLEIVWFNKPASLRNFVEAIQPLRYLMEEDEFESFRLLPYAVLKKRFHQFWKERDPTPQTPFNEAMEVFYRRVDEANRRWSSRTEAGWETDIGRIFILYGEPDEEVDHTLVPEGEPTLVWIYYLPDKKVVVTFRSLDGRKELELKKIEEFPLP